MVALETGAYGLAVGTPAIKSVGPLTFGPDGIVFVADNASATIFAIDLQDNEAPAEVGPIEVVELDARLAAYLGSSREDVFIRDMAVHPTSGNVYLSVMRGTGNAAIPVVMKLGGDGRLADVSLENVPFAQISIPDAPAAEDARTDGRVVRDTREGEEKTMRSGAVLRIATDSLRTITVTDLKYVDGALLVAGCSNEEFSSTLRRIAFPFDGEAASSSLEIFHVSHGRYETAAPIRTFLPFGDASVVASYTCTPVVHFALADLAPGAQAKGRTVAELGSGNTPVDIVSFRHAGDEYLLVSNTRHPLFKLAACDVETQEGLTEPKEPVGMPREVLPQQGVSRMANLGERYVLMLQDDEAGHVHLRSYDTETL